ncbi:MAG: hypothetical protein HQL11_02485 [Candidatus Omnitrophica bacterium]|nr:hypothetical protein [Candidatus Omnitrophota bacterium]
MSEYQKKLEEQVVDLEAFQRVAVDREIKMIELKEEIIRLQVQLGHGGGGIK